MDTAEKHILNHLQYRGYCDIIHEPDGKIPPDFSVEGRIAVEVRRLNADDNTNFRNGKSFFQSTKNILSSFGPPRASRSWFVSFHFYGELEWKILRPKIKTILEEVISHEELPLGDIEVVKN